MNLLSLDPDRSAPKIRNSSENTIIYYTEIFSIFNHNRENERDFSAENKRPLPVSCSSQQLCRAAIRSGDEIKTVGHATASFTIDVYGHFTDAMRRESANRMQALIENAGKQLRSDRENNRETCLTEKTRENYFGVSSKSSFWGLFPRKNAEKSPETFRFQDFLWSE